jgi:transposase-like protein
VIVIAVAGTCGSASYRDVKVAGRWRYVDRAIDQFGQVIDVFMSRQRDARAARQFFEQAIGTTKVVPVEVVTPERRRTRSCSRTCCRRPGNALSGTPTTRVEADHGRLKSRLRPMRGLKQDRNARVIVVDHAFVQNVRRGTTSWPVGSRRTRRVAVAFDELAMAI